MSAFHDLLTTVHSEIWEAGTESRTELSAALEALGDEALPEGVTRLPTAAMVPGPHLAAQEEDGETTADVVWLEAGRLARARARRFAAL